MTRITTALALLCVFAGCSKGGSGPTTEQVKGAQEAELGVLKEKLRDLRVMANSPQNFVPAAGSQEPGEFVKHLNEIGDNLQGFLNASTEPQDLLRKLLDEVTALQKTDPKASSPALNSKLDELVTLAAKLPGGAAAK